MNWSQDSEIPWSHCRGYRRCSVTAAPNTSCHCWSSAHIYRLGKGVHCFKKTLPIFISGRIQSLCKLPWPDKKQADSAGTLHWLRGWSNLETIPHSLENIYFVSCQSDTEISTCCRLANAAFEFGDVIICVSIVITYVKSKDTSRQVKCHYQI